MGTKPPPTSCGHEKEAVNKHRMSTSKNMLIVFPTLSFFFRGSLDCLHRSSLPKMGTKPPPTSCGHEKEAVNKHRMSTSKNMLIVFPTLSFFFRGSLDCLHYQVKKIVIDIHRHGLFSFKHVSLRCLLFNSHLTTYQSNIGVQLRNRAT